MIARASVLLSLSLLLAGCAGSGVYINEIVASNQTGLTDEGGAFPDWIELHNAGSSDVSLDGWFVSDDEAEPQRHALDSSLVVEAGGYLVLYADGDTEEGPLHLAFKLKAAGEQAVPCDDAGVLDVVTFGEQQTDSAWALGDDGLWSEATPSPGAANE